MGKKTNGLKTGCSRIVWAVIVIVLCAAPCSAEVEVASGDTLNIGTGYPDEQINDWVDVYGTLNMYPDAYIGWYVLANDGSTVNITGGTVVMWIDVAAGAEVTVYGTYFEVDGVQVSEGIIDDLIGTLTVLYENATETVDLTFDCQFGATVTLAPPGGPETIIVDIDIKPGSDPNPINPGSNGLIPVAILTTDGFDASTVDPDSVTLAGSSVAVRGKSEKMMARMEDIDGDGDDDLLLQVETQSDDALWESGTVTLLGKTYDGQAIEGTDDVVIVPPE